MSKRKETRMHCTYALRDRESHTLTEFRLHNYDGEGEDIKGIISAMHDVMGLVGESLETRLQTCLNIIREPNIDSDKPFLCSKLEVTVMPEKIEEPVKKSTKIDH